MHGSAFLDIAQNLPLQAGKITRETKQRLQKAGEGRGELSHPMGEHLGPVPSPGQQLGDYKGQRELGGCILVFAAPQGITGSGSA